MGRSLESFRDFVAQNHSAHESGVPMQSTNRPEVSTQANIQKQPERSGPSRGGQIASFGLGALAVIGATWGVGYGAAAIGIGSGEIKTEAEVQSGKGEVVSLEVDMEKFPIRLAAADTNTTAVGALNDKFSANFFGLEIEIPTGQSKVDRAAVVKTELVIQPKTVKLAYDSEANALSIDATDASLSTEVNTRTGTAKTTDAGLIGTPYWKEKLSVDAKAFKGTTDLIASAFGNNDGVRLPIVQDIVDGELTTQSRMESFLDFYMVTKVDEKCTPLIYDIPNFSDYLKQNIRTAVQGRVLDLDEPNNVLSAMLSDPDVGIDGIKEVVANAEVTIPTAFEIGADQEKITALKEIQKSDLFKDIDVEKDNFTCGISKDLTLKPIDDTQESTNE